MMQPDTPRPGQRIGHRWYQRLMRSGVYQVSGEGVSVSQTGGSLAIVAQSAPIARTVPARAPFLAQITAMASDYLTARRLDSSGAMVGDEFEAAGQGYVGQLVIVTPVTYAGTNGSGSDDLLRVAVPFVPWTPFPVTLTQTGGSAGGDTTASTFTYTVTSLDSVELGTSVSPAGQRPNPGKLVAATIGTAYYDGAGALVLHWCDEVFDTAACTT